MRALRDDGYMPLVEVAVGVALILVVVASYFVLTGDEGTPQPLNPPLVAFLLVANLVPAVGVLVLVGRRVAMRRAAASVGGGGRLHVRLVALFSALAAVPMLLLVIFASLLFQYGVEFWFSDRARGMLENANILARQSYQQALDQVELESVTAASDLGAILEEEPIDSPGFPSLFLQQIYYRNLTEGAIVSVTPQNGVQTLAIINPYDRDIESQIDPAAIARLRRGEPSVVLDRGDRIAAFVPMAGRSNMFLYAARASNPQMRPQYARAEAVLNDYRALMGRSRGLQLQFNAILLGVSLLIVAIAVWIALRVADRFVRPVGELVGAARRVADGDLTARVPDPRTQDEIGTLASAFNRMTRRLEEQTGALVSANAQLDSRRALIEAVMSGVSAGILSIDDDGNVRLINASALELLRREEDDAVGHPLSTIAPELAKAIADGERETIVHVDARGEALTLAVRIVRDASGHILTFDDITQQLLDQRRAAWSDVARRIAHEIKNPLTPIQLAAERLQRRYGGKIDAEDGVFARLTDTIVRQVGDLRRMVDEFSSFARMPKPVFREESLLDIVRQSVFLHEVANPAIAFSIAGGDQPWPLVCDRRQLGQALTNILKNAIEAIGARGEDAPAGRIDIAFAAEGKTIRLDIADNGIGLPVERERLVEPYMTTRARGTGLGLAIVKKIVEEHFGTITFDDNPGGGSIVSLCFEPQLLAALDGGEDTIKLERTP
ncbi:HAMP domain-containing protein [Sphingomonas gilva]|uniref:histidine kinase n=1 Tax=Sphingomonas gilva TaxID=2305907 RepID=A0A396RK20_9SPHN|nr:ATP-binding protein [Sphingomonas gilva]RHW16520.1 HAMP domain-containing protein [Sphingomonas gilva]